MFGLQWPFKLDQVYQDQALLQAWERAGVLARLELNAKGKILCNPRSFLRFFQGVPENSRCRNISDIVGFADLNQLLKELLSSLCDCQPRTLQCNFHFPERQDRHSVLCHVLIVPHPPTSKKRRVATKASLYVIPVPLLGQELEALKLHRMVNLGSLSAGVAHDLNNLLTGISSFATLLEDDLSPSERKSYLELIRRTVHRASKLTGSIVSYLREADSKPTAIDPLTCVRDVVMLMKHTLRESIQLHLSLPSRSHGILIRRSELSQVILNLLINARDAIEGSGEIWVQGSFEPLQGPKNFVLEVRDTGIGIPAKDIPHIFDPFYSTKRQDQAGAGLGLPIVKKIVSEVGGSLDVESVPGRHTRFSIQLPTTDRVAVRQSSQDVAGGREKILVLQTQDSEGYPLLQLLAHKGYQTHWGRCDDDPSQSLKKLPWKPDLILIDMTSAFDQALARFAELRKVFPQAKVLFTLCELPPMDLNRPPGAAFLQKPFEADELWQAVRKLLDHS